jgi:hypothetical protein
LQAIAEHNDRIAKYQVFYNAWARSQRSDNGQTRDSTLEKVYRSARLSQLRDRAIEGLLKKQGRRRFLDANGRAAASVLVQSFADWPGDGVETLTEFDVYFRLRRLFRLTYVLFGLSTEGPIDQDGKRMAYRDLWGE